MSFTLKLDNLTNDLIIKDGKFVIVSGSDQVVQRIKIALGHYFAEYFLNTNKGVPWYEEILGAKGGSSTISSILRKVILDVPGVLRIASFSVINDSAKREYSVFSEVIVAVGPNEESTASVVIDGLNFSV